MTVIIGIAFQIMSDRSTIADPSLIAPVDLNRSEVAPIDSNFPVMPTKASAQNETAKLLSSVSQMTNADQLVALLKETFNSVEQVWRKGSKDQCKEIIQQLSATVANITKLESQCEKQLEDIQVEADQYRAQVESEVQNLLTKKAELQTQVEEYKERLGTVWVNVIQQTHNTDPIAQLTAHWEAQREDRRREKTEFEDAKKASKTLQQAVVQDRNRLQAEQVNFYADRLALERAQKLVEHDRETVVSYAKELEETLLKTDPTYIAADSEDHKILTGSIFHSLINRFNVLRDQARDKENSLRRDAGRVTFLHCQLRNISRELIDLKESRAEMKKKFDTAVNQRLLLKEQLEGEVEMWKEQLEGEIEMRKKWESYACIADDRNQVLVEYGQKTREDYERSKESLRDAQLKIDELKAQLTNTREVKLQSDTRYNELLAELDIVRRQLTAATAKGVELQEQVTENAQAQNQLARLQGQYTEICREVEALRVSELESRKALAGEQNAHARTQVAYTKVNNRIDTAVKETQSAQ